MTSVRSGEAAPESALAARAEALRLAFAPFLFQATLALREQGVLALAWAERQQGVTREQVAERTGLSAYAATVLLEAGLAAGVLSLEGERFFPTLVGYFLLCDEMVRVNMEFARDVCYRPLQHLVPSLHEGRPRGLAELGEGLAGSDSLYRDFERLTPIVAESWLAFDHYYSGLTYDTVLGLVLREGTERVLDVGANDGRFAEACLLRDDGVHVTLVDHGVQLPRARARLEAQGLGSRAAFVEADLASAPELPAGFQAIWVSQVLDCLSESEVVLLLTRLKAALVPGGRLFVLEPCWDLQPQRAGRDVLTLLSLYFTCAANGKSRMYDSATLTRLLSTGGFTLVARRDGLGVGHSLFECATDTPLP